ncbi:MULTISPECIES: DUF5704 domain-containing protein [Paenibacillus]|uniref:DUF5704 domain-containing protein n=3 Tax=Paenibacillus TaxID=44249 RepID=G4HIL2_9BACL|nr:MULTISPECIES: DUF5704 domain-containing protein [Paenibacillus]EHB63185.1 hypothetical protein PaelaDRAFT_3823 [Paenibacillus lactis 154]
MSNRKLYQRVLCMLLACTFFMPFFVVQQAAAAPPQVIIRDGKIQFEITSTAASTSIRYRTVGWVVTREQVCSTTSPKQCADPRSRPHALFMNQEVRQIGQHPDPPVPGQPLTSYYEIPEEIVTQRLWQAGMEGIQNNDDLYFYAVMVSVNADGSVRKGPFYTLSGIKQAEGWRFPDDLDDYFGLHIPYRSAEFPVDVIAKTVDGRVIDRPDVTFEKGKFEIGETINHEFPAVIEDNGKTYTIARSYISPKQDPSRKTWVQENPETNEKVRIRSFTVALGGTNLIAEYHEENTVKAIYMTEGGQVLKEVDKGEYATGDEVNHTFEAALTKDGQTYEIIRSYITNNNKPDEKLFIQEKGDSKLLDRSIFVGSGGSNFIGIYKGGNGGTDDETEPGAVKENEVMNPDASAVIQADTRGAERFDVLQGIPTSESLYVQANAKAYLYRNKFTEIKGTKTYPITVSRTYTLRWTEYVSGPPDSEGNPTRVPVSRSDTQTVTKSYTVERKYSYWLIDRLEVYGLQKAEVSNYALPSGQVTLKPNGYAQPRVSVSHDATHQAHIIDPVYQNVTLPGQTIQGGSSRPSVPNEDWTNAAEQAVGKIKVKNDSLIFNGQTIMDNRITEETAPPPREIPTPPEIGQNVLYSNGLLIDASKPNKAEQPSSGTIFYALIEGIGGGQNQSYPIDGINPVTVHTPVVNQASVSDDQAHNQKTLPTAGRAALILDRPFTVIIPTNGAHRDIKGYGNRDYGKYMRDKQVWFPFDVYKADRKTLIPKETWTSIPVGQIQTTFYLPVWVDEGNYDVLFRTIAENSPPSFTSQMNANLDLTHHVATQVVPVEVIGRVYDFRITDIADFNWETVFRRERGSATPTGNAYWVGTKGIDGAARGNQPPYVLPIRPGSHPDAGKKNVAVKTGYHIKFELKSMGNMFGSDDGIKITPTFYFVDSKGKNRQEVDLYYHSGNKRFIRIGSSADVERRHVTLDTRLRNMSQQELTNTASSLWSLNGASGNQQTFIQQFLKDAQQPVYVGGYDVMLLPPRLRTFIGSMEVPSGIDVSRAHASVQRWVGEYSLPAAPYVVPKGFNLAEYGRTNRLDDKSPIFLRDGYIIVNFNIETIRNQNVNQPHLQYIHAPLSNQWRREGFQHRFVDPYGATFSLQDGDMVFYHADLSSYDDFGTGGTH